jgi:amidase
VTDVTAHGALELVRLVRSREVSRREVVDAHFARIDAVNGTVNAIVELREATLADADAADADHERRAGLPLDGVPVSIKDHFDVEGMKHTEGVRALGERRSPGTSLAVERLVEAGAFVVGKANQPDYAIRWNTVNDLYGPTRNPRDPALTAGGSSGGDAAAVASGMASLGLGGDYGGSIRVPASFCGVYGLRPSAGRVPDVQVLEPLGGLPTMDLMATVGPMARSLEDLWAAFRALAGPDPRDPVSLPVAAPPPSGERCRPPTVARMCRETGATVSPEVERELDRVCDALAAGGYQVVEDGIPGAVRAPELWGGLVGTEALVYAMPVVAEQMCESGRDHVETMHGELLGLGERLEDYLQAAVERSRIAQQTAVWMEEHPLVVCPIAGMPTPPLDFDHLLSVDESRELFDRMRNVVWVNLLSLPGIALPNGIQIVARRFHEAEALAAATAAAGALAPVAVAQPA